MPIVVFADGASSGNPGPGGWGSIIVDEAHLVQELGGAEPHTTNNRMELAAALAALIAIGGQALPGARVDFYTDSSYVIHGITQWIHGWKRNGWKKAEGGDVSNRDLWEALDRAARACGKRVDWKHVPGHAGVPGNERADQIAVQMRQGLAPPLYKGPLEQYEIPILDLRPAKKTAPKAHAKGPSYYLSWVGGTLARHSSWEECQARVKGVSGARYKKISSPQEERETLASWNMGHIGQIDSGND